MSETATESKKPRTRGVTIATVAVLALVGVVAILSSRGSTESDTEQPTFVAKRGPLTISVTEAGTIQARELEIIKSQVEGQTTIIQLIPEGTRVKKGDLLVELDTSTLEDRKADRLITVQNSETAWIRARENLEVVKNQAQSDIAKAELDFQFAKEDLIQYEEGEFPKLLKESESKITLEKEELENAIEKLKWSERLFDEKYISETELESDRLTRNRASLDHELAVANRDLLKEYTHTRRVAELQSAIEETERALERVKLRANSDIIQAEADLKNKAAEYEQQKAKLAKFEDQIAKAKIFAPVDGMVVYATSSRASWRGNAEPLDEGQSVRERQELIHLPTTNAIMAELKVHESNLDKISLDLPVRITVDAPPGKRFIGRVAKIAPLPDAQSIWMNPDLKVYRTEIHIDEPGEELRTGMSCQNEIIVERYEDAVYVPVQAIVRSGTQTLAYVEESGEFVPRPVTIGLDNNRMVAIVKGIEEGETVLLTPPLKPDESEAVESEDDDLGGLVVTKTKPSEAKPKPKTEAKPAEGAPQNRGGRERGGSNRGGGGNWQNMSEEERKKARERFNNMSEEEKAKLRERWSGGGNRGSGNRGGNRGGGRGGGGRPPEGQK